MKANLESELVQKCLLLIEAKLDWGSSKLWHNEVFLELSEQIQEQTKVLLSPTTLKRVWGRVQYNSAPSISTLNALAQFAGYLNWRDFKNNSTAQKASRVKMNLASSIGALAISAILIAVVLISFYAFRSGGERVRNIDYSKIEFSSRPITKGLPNSVVFDFDLQNIESDSIYIQQYWDITKTIKLKQQQKQATGQYYYPGYFRAKLLIDGNIIKEHDLFIKTEGWLATIDYKPIPKYIESQDLPSQGLALTDSIVAEIKSNEQALMSSFHYVDEIVGLSGDDFTLTTSIKNSYQEKWAVCQKANIVIVGTKSAFIVPFSIPGCVSEIGIMLSEMFLSGKENDLSALGADLSFYRDIKIEVKNKSLTVFIDNEKVFTHAYTESIGNIVGARYRFLGAGEVGYLNIKSGETDLDLIENNMSEF